MEQVYSQAERTHKSNVRSVPTTIERRDVIESIIGKKATIQEYS